MTIYQLALIIIAFLPLTAVASDQYQQLKFKGAYAIQGVEELEPSGLTFCHDKLLFVSDNHDNTVFELEINKTGGVAQAKPYLELENLPAPPEQDFPLSLSITKFFAELFGISGWHDWEGLACGDAGEIYLASEYHFSVLEVKKGRNKTTASWLGENLYKVGEESGMFQTLNAYIEGIAYHKGQLYLAAEREPRGIIRLDSRNKPAVYAQPGPYSSLGGLAFDFTGLTVNNNKLITLERNEQLICERNLSTYETQKCWSFKHISKSEKWGYREDTYGIAEGVTIIGNSLWIIVDNNGNARKNNKNDMRPLIMAFECPDSN